MSSTDNVKISDSGYTRENGQSQESSGNSLSKIDNKNQSESSGYCGGQPSALGSSNDAVQQLNNEGINDSKINQLKTALKSNLMENSEVDHTKKQSESKELMDVRDQNGHSTVLEHKRVSKSNLSTNGFYTIISLSDGIVLHSTVSSEKSLGYLKDSWIGKSFIDYVDPQDQTYFAEKVVNNITMPFDELEKDLNGQTINFYCRLRTNENLIDIKNNDESDYVKDINKNKTSIYIPFYFNVGFKYFGESESNNNPLMMFVTIIAWPVLSFYKAPEETIMSSVFSTRHTASCHLSFIDDDAVQYFGYLPQDIIGRSLFDFYHPDDLLFIKEVYETVVRLQVGTSFRSKPYRFLSQNGDYIMIDTKWSSFINPWTDKIEFITGHHRVLRGPTNQNVFDLSSSDHQYSALVNNGDEIYKQLQIIESEIQSLLNKRVEKTKMIENKKSYHLAELMDTIGQEIQRSCIPSNIDDCFLGQKNPLYEENNSVVHHNYCDSKISDRTPSYDQLNYNEKIAKFFSSDIQINKDFRASFDTVNSNGQNFDNKTSPSHHNSSKNNNSSGSGEKLSNGSNDNGNFNSSSQNNFKLPVLTEALLHKHNQEMEKQMIQQYTEKFSTIDNEKFDKFDNEINEINDTHDKSTRQKKLKDQKNGKKRRHSSSINKLLIKISKMNDESETAKNKNDDTIKLNKSNKIIEINISKNCTTKNKSSKDTKCSGDPNTLPISKTFSKTNLQENNIMLITPEQKINSQLSSTSKINQQNSNVSYSELEKKLIYPQVINTSPIVLIKNTPSIVINMPINNKQAESQATSIEVQPSSVAVSDSSKKIFSIGEHVKTCKSAEESAINTIDLSMHDSSDSSFYGSFLSSSSSNSSKERNKEILKKRLNEMKNKCQRHFSMIDDMKANFKKQQKKIRNDLSKEKIKRNDLLKKKKYLVAKNKITQEKLIKMTPSWLEGVKTTPDLTYRYQLVSKPLDDILQADMMTLNNTNQPQLVNEQFKQLCIDFEINQLSNLFINNSDASNNSSNQQYNDFINNQDLLSSQAIN